MFYHFVIVIVILHFIGDWLFQSRWMADNKNKFSIEGWDAWFQHIGAYTGTMLAGMYIFLTVFYPQLVQGPHGPGWVLINGIMHGVQDKITSYFTHKLYEKKKFHAFFTVIGFDGMLHYLTLFISAKIMFGL